MNKPLVIYHASCADGFGAAFAAWLVFGEDAEYVAKRYGEVKNANDLPCVKEREVYILDFSFDLGIMETLMILADKVIWLDHHKTAFELWCDDGERNFHQSFGGVKDHYVTLDNNKCGAMLAWEYFHPDTEVPLMFKHIDDYDRWQFKLDGTKEFNKALWAGAPWNFPQWKELMGSDAAPMYKAGKAILCAHSQNVQSVVKGSGRKCRIDDPNADHNEMPWWDGLAANCPPHLTSDVGHELANQSGTFGLCWTLHREKLVANCSMRSNGDYDVSAIAKAFGGGGHRNAAGFEVPIETLLGWLK